MDRRGQFETFHDLADSWHQRTSAQSEYALKIYFLNSCNSDLAVADSPSGPPAPRVGP